MKNKGILLLTVIVFLAFVYAPTNLNAKSAAAKGVTNLTPGMYVIQIDAPMSLPSSVHIMDSGRLGQPYKHAGCGGWVADSNLLNDKGVTQLRCEKCGKLWDKKVGSPSN